jgi:hypothetical protein
MTRLILPAVPLAALTRCRALPCVAVRLPGVAGVDTRWPPSIGIAPARALPAVGGVGGSDNVFVADVPLSSSFRHRSPLDSAA